MLVVAAHEPQIPPASPCEEISQTALQIWEKVKEYWNAFVAWISDTSVSFWFFRGVEAIYPNFAAKLESGYLYATQFFRDLFAQQREADLQQQLHRLTTDAAELQDLVRRLGREKREVEEAYQTFRGQAQVRIDFLETRLGHFENDNHVQAQEIEALRIVRQDPFPTRQLEREKALNQILRNQIAALTAERDTLVIKRITIVGRT